MALSGDAGKELGAALVAGGGAALSADGGEEGAPLFHGSCFEQGVLLGFGVSTLLGPLLLGRLGCALRLRHGLILRRLQYACK